jgi:alkylation response protein AidB-like acyl-CoA dehydrogenase
MDFTYSEEQRMLADSLRRFVESEYTFESAAATRANTALRPGIWSRWRRWACWAVPADHGGFGHGPASQVVVQRELGRALVQEPVIPSGVIATAILAHHAPAALQAEWLPAIAMATRSSRWPIWSRTRVIAWKSPGRRPARPGRRLRAQWPEVGGLAWRGGRHVLVSAMLDGALALFLVSRDATGLTVTGYPTMDRLSGADLQLADVPATLVTTNGLEALELGSITALPRNARRRPAPWNG